ncbi:MAG: hypothetical protein QG588_2356 [Candidatus Poribacteria bacterium]|nr:hypothetical protein [Candidatus Poribacteria bacterium]
MSVSVKKLGWTLIQVITGSLAGFLACWVSLQLINLVWQGLISLSLGNFLTGLLLLISFLIVLCATLIATSESVRQIGRFIPKETSRRKIYEGCFIGLCSAVAILSVTRGDWISTLDEWSGLIKLIATLFYILAFLPLKLVTFWIPALFLIVIAAPIGAVIGYNLSSALNEKKVEANWIFWKKKEVKP